MARGVRRDSRGRFASAELTVKDRMGRGLRSARKRLRRFARSSKRIVGGAMRGVGRVAAVAGLGITAALVAAGSGALKFEEGLTRLQIATGRSAADMAKFRTRIDDVSKETGLARNDVLAAATSFVTLTGDMKTATRSMGDFAKIAVASDSSMTDIANTAAALSQNLKVRPEEMMKVFSIIIAGGKAGAIELKDLSTLLSTITPMFAQFGNVGASGMAELGAMLQLTRQGFGSAAESVTGLQGMMVAFQKNAAKFKRGGVKIFERDENGNKRMRRLRDIVIDLGNSKLAKDPTRLAKAFGRIEGLRAFQQLVKVEGALDQLIETTGQADDAARDYVGYQNSEVGKLAKKWNDVKLALAKVFTTERIATFTTALEAATAAAAEFLDRWQDGAAIFDPQSSAIKAAQDAGQSNAEIARSGLAGSRAQQAQAMHDAGVPTSVISGLDFFRHPLGGIEPGIIDKMIPGPDAAAPVARGLDALGLGSRDFSLTPESHATSESRRRVAERMRELRRERVDVTIEIDPMGLLKVRQAERDQGRRSVQ